MGLDMYAFQVEKGVITESVDFGIREDAKFHDQIYYWRKHPNLHGWMEKLYYEKGGNEETFNCVNLQLTEDDLNRLEADVNNNMLPETDGFFFGQSSPEDKEKDLEFIAEARRSINEGHDVYYTSWW